MPIIGGVVGHVDILSLGTSTIAGSITVRLDLRQEGTTTAPVGALDTPAENATVQGSIAVTGWALDDIAIDRVELWRDLQPGETTVPFSGTATDPRAGKIFIAVATPVEGARPDVEQAYANLPRASRAGWGYLLLTQGLWNGGNGTYTFYAYAIDPEAHVTSLGKKTVAVDNAHATKPFGSIDTPGIGASVSGVVTNFGWALTPTVNGAATCKIQPNGVQV